MTSATRSSPRRWPGIALAATILGCVVAADAESQSLPTPPSPESAFDHLHRVATHPRCVNCHGMRRAELRIPSIGESEAAPHPMNVTERHNVEGNRVLGIVCTSCHGMTNSVLPGGPPGAGKLEPVEEWRMPPHPSMSLDRQLSKQELCRGWQKGVPISFAKKGGACDGQPCTLPEFFVHHVGNDPLIAWAFDPGGGRDKAPGDVKQLEQFARVWAPMLENATWCNTIKEERPR